MPFLFDVCADHFTDLDAPLRLLGYITVSELAGDDDVTVAELDHVADCVDIGHNEVLVRFDAVGEIVKAAAFRHPNDFPHDRTRLRLHLEFDASGRGLPLLHLDRIEIEVRSRSGQTFDGDTADRDLLDQLLVVGVDCVESVDLGVLDLVRGGVPQHHQRIELSQCVQGLIGADLLGFIDDDDGPVRLDHVDRPARLEVVEFVIDSTLVFSRRVKSLDVDDHRLHAGIGAKPFQLVQL